MMIPSTVLEAMAASGCTVEQIIAVVKAAEQAHEERMAAKRAKDRERQQRHRARNAVSRTVTPVTRDNCDTPSPLKVSPHTPLPKTPNPIAPLAPLKGGSAPHENSPVSKRGTRLPDDFEPDMAAAEEAGLSQAEALREADKFRDHFAAAPGQRGVKLDWPATWRNWCRRAAEARPRRNGTAPPRPLTIGEMFRDEARREGILLHEDDLNQFSDFGQN